MTALAMIIGMVPMALGLGEAGEQNAPLGRAVIGGLIWRTLATLFIVPIFYTLLRRKPPSLHRLDARFAQEATRRVGHPCVRSCYTWPGCWWCVGAGIGRGPHLAGTRTTHTRRNAEAAGRGRRVGRVCRWWQSRPARRSGRSACSATRGR